jgi:amidophosphoribosyltransferase
MNVEDMRLHIKADSLAFVSIDGLYRATGQAKRNVAKPQFCDACFSGDYPIELSDVLGGRKDAQLSLLAEVA